MYGLIIAFKNVSPLAGFQEIFFGGTWAGLSNFQKFINSPYFWNVFSNTITISIYNLVVTFPTPIILALIFNEIGNKFFKSTVQTISYLPHFLSAVIITSLVYTLLSTDGGLINESLKAFTKEPIFFLGDSRYFRTILISMNLWSTIGWGSIIYIAALTGVDVELYEAAKIDGAGKLKQLIHITIPGIISVIIVMLILKIGHIMDAGFENILLLYSPQVYDVADIIDTFVYREGLGKLQFSYTTAVSLFKSVIGFALVIMTNSIAKKFDQKGIW